MTAPEKFASRFEIDEVNRVCVVSLVGALDPEAVEDVHPQVQELVQAGFHRFVFDLSRLEHMGSMGLRLLIGLANQLKGGGSVALCSAANGVRTIFEMTKVTQVLPMYISRTEAVDAVRK